MTSKHHTTTTDHTDYRVYQTTDYDRFIFAESNRAVSPAHQDRLRVSITENGYLPERPIDVLKRDDKLVILDGQHRFTACRELSLPIFYTVKDDSAEEASKAIRVINAYSMPWKDDDFLNHFLALESPAYVKLKKFMDHNDVGVSVAMALLKTGGDNLSNTKEFRHDFRNGNLHFDDHDLDQASDIMGPVNEIRNFHERLMYMRKHPAFIKALIIMTSSRIYEHDRFMKNLGTNIVMCAHCTSVSKYLDMLSSIYNYKRKDGTRVILSSKGMTAIGRDEEA